ncbi:MAG: Resolvase domain protein [Actinomycetia bacterium]|nr:Resolvase domain protein [Actinomycetes bacterium]
MPLVALYTRLSKEPESEEAPTSGGEPTSTARQERLCRRYADARGWTVSDVFEDYDISAYSGVQRPSFELLRSAIEEGHYDGVLVWKLDRLARRPADFERFWQVCEYRSVFLASVTEPVDSSSELGVAIVRLLVTFAGLESSTKSIREKAKERELAEAGRPHACRPSFGWTGRYEALEPTQAAMIEEAAERVLRDESLNSIATVWNARGAPTPGDSPWSAGTIRSILAKAALTGDRAYLGQVVATDCWPPILDHDTFARVQLVLADRARPANGRRSRNMLSGILYCGRCGGRLIASKSRGRRTYVCRRRPAGCSGVSIQAAPLEAWVLAECDRRDVSPPAATADIVEHTRRLRELARDYYATRTISRDEFLAARLELAGDEPVSYADKPLGGDVGAGSLYVANRLARAVVQPGRVGLPFDPTRVETIWRTEPLRPLVKRTRPRTAAGRLDADDWLTNDQARHVLCDMNIDAFHALIRAGRLRPWRTRGARFRRRDVEAALVEMRFVPMQSGALTRLVR